MKQTRMRPAARKKQIIALAVKLAEEGDYKEVSARLIGEHIGIAASSVMHHFPTMTQLRRALMREAARVGNVTVLAQGVRDDNAHALRAEAGPLGEAKELAEQWL